MATRVHQTPPSASTAASTSANKISPTAPPPPRLPEIISNTVARVDKKAGPRLTAEQHHELVQVTAYYLAERRGFEAGHESEDWATAENLVIDSSGLPVT